MSAATESQGGIPSIVAHAEPWSGQVAILDPPRAGCHSSVLKLLRNTRELRRLIFVFCNPNVLLDNLTHLVKPCTSSYKGAPFRAIKAVPVDLFPHTPHCELAVLLER